MGNLGRRRLFSLNPGKSIGELPDPAGRQPVLPCSDDNTIPEGNGLPFFEAEI
jgi:hypothetical protein